MSASSVALCSSSTSFGMAVALFDRLSHDGVRVSVCPYTGAAFCKFNLRSEVVPFWEAIMSLAFMEMDGCDYDYEYVAHGALFENPRYMALDALLFAAKL